VTKIKSLTLVNYLKPKGGARVEPLFNRPASKVDETTNRNTEKRNSGSNTEIMPYCALIKVLRSSLVEKWFEICLYLSILLHGRFVLCACTAFPRWSVMAK